MSPYKIIDILLHHKAQVFRDFSSFPNMQQVHSLNVMSEGYFEGERLTEKRARPTLALPDLFPF